MTGTPIRPAGPFGSASNPSIQGAGRSSATGAPSSLPTAASSRGSCSGAQSGTVSNRQSSRPRTSTGKFGRSTSAPTPPVNIRWLGRTVPTRRRCCVPAHQRPPAGEPAADSPSSSASEASSVVVCAARWVVVPGGERPGGLTVHGIEQAPAREQQVDLVLRLPHRHRDGQRRPPGAAGHVEQATAAAACRSVAVPEPGGAGLGRLPPVPQRRDALGEVVPAALAADAASARSSSRVGHATGPAGRRGPRPGRRRRASTARWRCRTAATNVAAVPRSRARRVYGVTDRASTWR